jgi:HAD superfamily hydrolase (TIGR01509 family)
VNEWEIRVKKGLIVFDLDGVLIDSKEIHFEALNLALAEVDAKYLITAQEHVTTFDGLSTKKKLELLSSQRGLSMAKFDQIWEAKQVFTLEMLKQIEYDSQLVTFLQSLKSEGIFLSVASNSIRETVDVVLKKLGIVEFFDATFSNEDVTNPKPHPEIYWKSMMKFAAEPENTAILEDSHFGRQSAVRSGGQLIPIINRADVTWDKILRAKQIALRETNMNSPWKSEKMNVLIPMAGAGSRFEAAGFTFPKPLIEVRGKPMIQVVVENLNIQANYIFIVQKQHFEKYNLGYLLNLIAPNCKIVQTEGVTEGAACTTLLAKELIDQDTPLIIANSDQFIVWNSSETIYSFETSNIDGGLVTFESTHPKWSFVKLSDTGYVSEVAEKKPISNIATVGIYYWKKGSDYVKYAEQMVSNDLRINGEFYVCPVFNEAIKDGKKFRIKNISKMWGIGTPEDLETFLTSYDGDL